MRHLKNIDKISIYEILRDQCPVEQTPLENYPIKYLTEFINQMKNIEEKLEELIQKDYIQQTIDSTVLFRDEMLKQNIKLQQEKEEFTEKIKKYEKELIEKNKRIQELTEKMEEYKNTNQELTEKIEAFKSNLINFLQNQ